MTKTSRDKGEINRDKPSLSWFVPRVTTVIFASFSAGAIRTILSLFLPLTQVEGSVELGILLAASGIAGLNFGKAFGALITSKYVEKVNEFTWSLLASLMILIGGVMTFTQVLLTLSLGLFVVGMGLGIALTSYMGIGVSKFTAKYRGIVLGIFEVSTYVSISLGAFFIGLISNQRDYWVASAVVIILGTIAMILVFLFLKRTSMPESEKTINTALKIKDIFIPPVKTKPVILAFLVGNLAKITEFIVVALVPFIIIQGEEGTNRLVATILGLFTIAWASLLVIGARIGDKYGRKWIVVIGLLGQGTSLYYLIVSEPMGKMISALSLGASIGLYYSSIAVIANDTVPPNIRKRLLGSYRFIADMTPLIGIIVLGIVFVILYVMEKAFTPLIASYLVIGTAGIIIVYALFYAMFAPETNPVWDSLKDIQKHLEFSRNIIIIGKSMVKELEKNRNDNITQLLKKAKQNERDADYVVNHLKHSLLGSFRPGEDAKYFMQTVLLQDKAIGQIYRGLRLLVWLSSTGTQIPKNFLKQIEQQLTLLEHLVNRLYKAVSSVVMELTEFEVKQHGVKEVEEELDQIYDSFMALLISEGKNENFITFYVLKECVEHFEKAANQFEDASDAFMELIYTKIA